MSKPGQKYSSWRRPFRLQISPFSAEGFEHVPASSGQCQWVQDYTDGRCERFEWCKGAKYCRDHWLQVYQQTVLPERWGLS